MLRAFRQTFAAAHTRGCRIAAAINDGILGTKYARFVSIIQVIVLAAARSPLLIKSRLSIPYK